MNAKESYIAAFQKHIRRPGAVSLLNWLLTTDFFEAPASTKYHGNFAGGLVLHSLHVFYRMSQNCVYEFGRDCGEGIPFPPDRMESIAIAACCMTSARPSFTK